jgi:hypothetical protein
MKAHEADEFFGTKSIFLCVFVHDENIQYDSSYMIRELFLVMRMVAMALVYENIR